MSTPTKKHPVYQNNPFTIATDGLSLLFKLAQPIAILAIVLSVLNMFGGFSGNFDADYSQKNSSDPIAEINHQFSSIPMEAWIIIGLIGGVLLLGFIIIGTFVSGMIDYTAAQLANNKKVTFSEAFTAVAKRFFGYLWLQIWVGIKIFLWSLLLIVPGIIMAVRYSLAGPAFFRHNLSADAAIEHSSTITKGAWLTTFASFGLFNIITFGLIEYLLKPGTSGLLLRQYDAYNDVKMQKPAAHGLSWMTLAISIGLVVLAVSFIVLMVILFFIFKDYK